MECFEYVSNFTQTVVSCVGLQVCLTEVHVILEWCMVVGISLVSHTSYQANISNVSNTIHTRDIQ